MTKFVAIIVLALSFNAMAAKTIFHCEVESKPFFIQNFYLGNTITANDIDVFTIDKSYDNQAVLHASKKLKAKTRIDRLNVTVSAGQYEVDLYNEKNGNFANLSKIDYFNYIGTVILKNQYHYQVKCKRQPGSNTWFY